MLGCHHGFGCRLSGSRSKLHSLVRLSGPFRGADLPLAECRAQVLSRMPLAAPARSAGYVLDETEHGAMRLSRFGLYESNQREVGPPASSKTATPNHVFPAIPGDRNELVECHCEATRGRSPVSPDRPTKIVLRRSVESALRTLVGVVDHAPGSPCHERHVQSIEHQSCGERGGH